MARTIIKKGERFDRVVTLKYADTGEYADLTDCTAFCQMRNEPGGTLLATAECSVTPEFGRVSASFDSSVTEELPVGNCGFDIWLVCEGTAKPIRTEEVTIIGRYTDNFN